MASKSLKQKKKLFRFLKIIKKITQNVKYIRKNIKIK